MEPIFIYFDELTFTDEKKIIWDLSKKKKLKTNISKKTMIILILAFRTL